MPALHSLDDTVANIPGILGFFPSNPSLVIMCFDVLDQPDTDIDRSDDRSDHRVHASLGPTLHIGDLDDDEIYPQIGEIIATHRTRSDHAHGFELVVITTEKIDQAMDIDATLREHLPNPSLSLHVDTWLSEEMMTCIYAHPDLATEHMAGWRGRIGTIAAAVTTTARGTDHAGQELPELSREDAAALFATREGVDVIPARDYFDDQMAAHMFFELNQMLGSNPGDTGYDAARVTDMLTELLRRRPRAQGLRDAVIAMLERTSTAGTIPPAQIEDLLLKLARSTTDAHVRANALSIWVIMRAHRGIDRHSNLALRAALADDPKHNLADLLFQGCNIGKLSEMAVLAVENARETYRDIAGQ